MATATKKKVKDHKENIGSMSRGKVREKLRQAQGANAILVEKLRKLELSLNWAENYIRLIEGSGD